MSISPEPRRQGRQKQARPRCPTAAGLTRLPLTPGWPFSDHRIGERAVLFLAAAGGRHQAEVEIAGFERVFVVGQRRLDQAGALEFVEAGQVVERLKSEM